MKEQVYALIGLPIDPHDLWLEGTRKCECEVDYDPKRPPNFCSKCGQKFIDPYKKKIDGFDFKFSTLHGYQILYETTCIDPDHSTCRAFLCLFWVSVRGCPIVPFVQLTTDNIDVLKVEMATKVGPKFWDEKKFGLYVVPKVNPSEEEIVKALKKK
jgi:hypothetical protein